MTDFLKAYSIQYWLESCPQGYLENTQYGHPAADSEPEFVLVDPLVNEQAISLTVQLVAGERCALAASSALINLVLRENLPVPKLPTDVIVQVEVRVH